MRGEMKRSIHNKLPESKIRKAIALYRKGHSSLVVAEKIGVSASTVCHYLRERGVDLHDPSLRNRLTNAQQKDVIRFYEAGKTMYEVADEIGTSYTTVFNCLKRHGVKSRRSADYRPSSFFDEHFFDNITTEEQAYFLGFMFADGCVLSDRNYSIRINLHEKDREILERFRALLRLTYPLYRFNTLNQYCLQVSSKHMSERLTELGCVRRKTLILKFPKWLPSELERHFIRGYFDGDGTVGIYEMKKPRTGRTTTHPKVSLSITGTKLFCQGTASVLQRDLGIKLSLYQTDKGGGRIYVAGVGGPRVVLRILDYLYEGATIFLERKHAKCREIQSYCDQVDAEKAARPKTCSECDRKVLARGLCRRHYDEWKHTDSDRPKCSKCNDGVYARGLCRTHYSEWRFHGADRSRCRACRDAAIANGYCQKHYKQNRVGIQR